MLDFQNLRELGKGGGDGEGFLGVLFLFLLLLLFVCFVCFFFLCPNAHPVGRTFYSSHSSSAFNIQNGGYYAIVQLPQ